MEKSEIEKLAKRHAIDACNKYKAENPIPPSFPVERHENLMRLFRIQSAKDFTDGFLASESLKSDGWVSVEDKIKPESKRSILLYMPKYNNMCSGYYDERTGNYNRHDEGIIGIVTHWRNLPETPTK